MTLVIDASMALARAHRLDASLASVDRQLNQAASDLGIALIA